MGSVLLYKVAQVRPMYEVMVMHWFNLCKIDLLPANASQSTSPLTIEQKWLWYLYSKRLIRNVVIPFSPTKIKQDKIQEVFQQLIDRYPQLSITVTDKQGKLQKSYLSSFQLYFRVFHNHFEDSEKDKSLFVQYFSNFELTPENGPLFRVDLVPNQEQNFFIYFSLHPVLATELNLEHLKQDLYALLNNQPLEPKSKFVFQSTEATAYSNVEESTDYWKQLINQANPTISRDKKSIQSHTFSFQIVDQESSSNSLILSALGIILSRYLAQTEFLLGIPYQKEGNPLLFLPFAIHCEKETPFSDFYQEVDLEWNKAKTFQEITDDGLKKIFNKEYPPLFQFLYHPVQSELKQEQLQTLHLTYPNIDIALHVQKAGEKWQGVWTYDSLAIEKETIQFLSKHFVNILENASKNDEKIISEWMTLPLDDITIPESWKKYRQDYPSHLTIHRCFEEQCEKTPHAIALCNEEGTMTYQELNEKANRLAHYLVEQGVTPKSYVGFCMERSLDMLVTILGILKAGAAYVPLDPTYPKERLMVMTSDAQLPHIILHSKFQDLFQEESCTLHQIEEINPILNQYPSHNLEVEVNPSDLAYIRYTSGSTGTPKGVCVPHRGIIRLVKGGNFIDFSADQTWLLFGSISFDAAELEMWGALLNGGKLVIFPPYTPSLEEYGQVIKKYGVTSIWLTAGLFHQMVDHRLEDLKGIKQLMAGGDVVSAQHVKRVLKNIPGCKVINGYGPTENTVFTTTYTISDPDQLGSTTPIGYPVPHTDVYILDEHLNWVAPGMIGELYIGGDGLAIGYLNRPDLTNEKFIPNPFRPGERLYKSGDLVRYTSEGIIEFIGRVDNQIKIRGFRVELGEVDEQLSQHPAVRECVTIVSRSENGDKKLVSYVRLNQSIQAKELRNYLKEKLPFYMVPAVIMFMDEFPLNKNGKIDRRALPKPIWNEEEDVQLPQSETEKALAEIWTKLLPIQQVNIEDSFFDLGGHSLLATTAITQISRRFGIQITLREFFTYPTIASLAKWIDEKVNNSEKKASKITKQIKTDGKLLPLSSAQKRLWFFDQLEPGSPLYNIPMVVKIQGQLDIEALKNAAFQLIQRHEILRSAYQEKNGEPYQVILSNPNLYFEVNDLTQHASPEETLKQKLDQEAKRPFNLSTGEVIRFSLYQLYSEEYALLVNVHHIASDGWSMEVLFQELFTLYHKGLENITELPIQYTDYAIWENQWLQSDSYNKQLNYWKEKLRPPLTVLSLPLEAPRSKGQSFSGDTLAIELPSKLIEKLHRLCNKFDATMYMTLLTALKVMLYRYTSQTDILVGSPISGRQHEGVESLIGFFINTLVIRSDLSGKPTFTNLLNQVKQNVLEAFENQEVPFEKLVETLQPERNQNFSPLFQVMFAYQSFENNPIRLPGLNVSSRKELHTGTSKFDLTLFIEQEENKWITRWEYNTDRFNADMIKRMANHYLQLLQSIIEAPEQSIDELQMITDEELVEVIYELNQTDTPFPQDKLLHELVEEQVRKTPDNIAAIYQGQTLTYRQLDEKANKLAHYLQEKGVKPDVCVGICIERSLELVISLLGVLKAGGAFMPLDTEAPAERIKQMLDDAEAPICLTQSHLLENLKTQSNIDSRFIAIDTLALEHYPSHPAPCHAKPEHLVSVYYTSGSTGKPKGVANTHIGWVNRMHWMQRQHNLQADETVLQKTTLTFDDSAVEFFWPLMVGARIAFIEPGLHRDPRAIIDAAIEYEASVVQFVPSMLSMVLDEITEEDRKQLKRLRLVVSSGEALHATLVEKFLKKMPGKLTNTWGATEVSIDSTIHICSEEDIDRSEIVSIGKPFDNNHVYILDSYMRPVPLGVPGDLYIAGIGLAREYLNNPERTKQSFIPNPFFPGERMYRTGDLGYYRSDGSIMFIGRKDNQIKIRGMRVELGEIESVLRTHPLVADAVVTVHQTQNNVQHLVAYTVLTESCTIKELRSYLQSKLPRYMVPSHYIFLDRLPLTPNGKVDRRGLPAPDFNLTLDQSHYEAPKTDTEKRLAEIWSDLLGLEQVGIHDAFFDLGGHSLLVVQMNSRILETFGIRLSIRTIFEKPTIAQLAAEIDQERKETTSLPAIPRVEEQEYYPLSFAQQRIYFLQNLFPDRTDYNMPFSLKLTGSVQIDVLKECLQKIVDQQESLRTVFVEVDEEVKQVILPKINLEIPDYDLTLLSETEQMKKLQHLYQEEEKHVFDLEKGPLFRVKLIHLKENEIYLIGNIHHIISDGWSLELIKTTLAEMYHAHIQGKSYDQPPLSIRYVDYAIWQQELMDKGVFDDQLDYWKRQLSGDIPVINLGPDKFVNQSNKPNPGRIKYLLDKDTEHRLRQISTQHQTTLFTTLLAAFKVLLHRYTDQKDILIGTPIINRDRKELESIIGLFLNTLVIRSQFTEEMKFLDLLQQLRQTTIDAFANQDIPFEKLVEELQPERNLNRNPFFDIFVNYVNLSDDKRNNQNTTVTFKSVDFNQTQSKFLITLYLYEQNDGILVDFVYNKEAFSAEWIDHMAQQYLALLEQITVDPNKSIQQYSLVTDHTINNSNLKQPLPKKEYVTVPEMLLVKAIEQGDKAALIYQDEVWTYQDLISHAAKWENALSQHGIKAGDTIAVTGKRSPQLISAIIGVWAAGGNILPLDPQQPLARQQEMLSQANAKLILSTEQISSDPFDLPTIQWNEVNSLHGELVNHAQTEQVAYIYFTSGSTGKPKGVIGTHRGLSHFLCWQKEAFGISNQDRFAQLTHLTFDVFLRDVFTPLISGATLYIPEDPNLIATSDILKWMKEMNIDSIHTVPSIASAWLAQTPIELPNLKRVFFAGEPLMDHLVKKWRETIAPNCQIVNLYGPTETTLAKCFYIVPENNLPQGVMPIGQPLPGTQVLIMNKHNQPCGVQEIGEIVIRTPYRTNGYLTDEQNKQSFRINPYTQDPDDLLYYTGDIGRYLADGTIEILGRQDDQIKIRGVRIDLNEIKAQILNHPDVRDCAVIPWKKDRLVAYIIPKSISAINTLKESLQSALMRTLPVVMIPSHFIWIDQLPLLPNGKVDKSKLPAPTEALDSNHHLPPQTETEQKLANIVCQLLGLENLNMNDNFFDVGGHSLPAMQLLSRVKEEFGVNLELRHIFEATSFRQLSQSIEQAEPIKVKNKPKLKQLSRSQFRTTLKK